MNSEKTKPMLLAVVPQLSICFATLMITSIANAAPLNKGDIVVVTQSDGYIYKIDRETRQPVLITRRGYLENPFHVLISDDGQIFTAERGSQRYEGIVKIDPNTGIQTPFASGPLIDVPVALSFDHNNNLIVGNFRSGIVQVDLTTGEQTMLTSLEHIRSFQDIDVDLEGRIVVLDFGDYGNGKGKIVRFDPVNDLVSTIAVGGSLFNPTDLLIDSLGNYIVANHTAGNVTQILEINPDTGVQTIEATLPSEGFIAKDGENRILFADSNKGPSAIGVNLETGSTDIVSSYNLAFNITGIAVSTVPEVSEFALLLTGAIGIGFVHWLRLRSFRLS